MIRSRYLLLAVLLVAPWTAFSQALPTISPFDFPAQFRGNAPGVTSVGTVNGVSLTAANSATVSMPNGVKVPVPINASTAIGKANLARAARIAKGLLGPLGAAALAYDVYNAIKDSGVITCPAPDFFCQGPNTTTGTPAYTTDPAGVYQGSGTSWNLWRAYPSVAHCGGSYPTGFKVQEYKQPGPGGGCNYYAWGFVPNVPAPAPYTRPYTDAEFETVLADKMTASPPMSERIYRGLAKDYTTRGLTVPPAEILPLTNPMTITASPVSSPAAVTSTRTYPNPDGSTSTETRTETVTVTPQTSGSTVSDATIRFQPSTSTQVETVNNTTGAVTTETIVSTPPAVGTAPTEGIEFPTDYNREATQQQMLDEIKAATAPAAPPDQEARVTDKVGKVDTDLKTKFEGLPNELTSDKANWFSWVWTPPVGQCTPFAGNVREYAISWDLCPTINNIREVLGFIFALFGALQIYGLIFKE